MISGPPRRMRSRPNGLDLRRVVALDHQLAVHRRGGRRTTVEFTVGLTEGKRRPQQGTKVIANKGWPLPWYCADELLGSMRAREHQHAVQTGVDGSGDVGVESITDEQRMVCAEPVDGVVQQRPIRFAGHLRL